MLKRLLNRPEEVTYSRLREICERNEAHVHSKIRIKDVIETDNSGISDDLYQFALRATNRMTVPGTDSI